VITGKGETLFSHRRRSKEITPSIFYQLQGKERNLSPKKHSPQRSPKARRKERGRSLRRQKRKKEKAPSFLEEGKGREETGVVGRARYHGHLKEGLKIYRGQISKNLSLPLP